MAFATSPTIIQVTGSVTQNAFTGVAGYNGNLAPVLVTTTSGNTTSYAIGAAPKSAALSGVIATTAAQTVSAVVSNQVLDRVTELRAEHQNNSSGGGAPLGYADSEMLALADPTALVVKGPPPSPAPTYPVATWARAFGDLEARTGNASYTFAGASSNPDLGYHQRTGGLLGGADFSINGVTSSKDALILGAFAGYTAAIVNLNTSGTIQNYSGGTFGAYATYLNGPFFADLMFKTDILGLNITGVALNQSTGTRNYSFIGNIGYRFDFDKGWYAEPTAGLDYTLTDFTQQYALTATTVALTDGDVFRGRIGSRIGVAWVDNNIRYEPSLTALAYEVFQSTTSTALLSGPTGFSLPSDVGKVRGELQAVLNVFDLTTHVSGFVRGDLRFGEDLVGGGAKLGVRYQW